MANQGGGYNQFGGYGQIPGQAQQGRQPYSQDSGTRPQRPGLPPLNTSTTGTSNMPTGQSDGQGWGPRPRPPAPTAPPAPQPQTQQPPASQGAAGQAPPSSSSPGQGYASYAPQQAAPTPPAAAPTYHAELGNFGDAGAWTNGYNPHMVQDPMAPTPAAPPVANSEQISTIPTAQSMPQQYPQGTFPASRPPPSGAAPGRQFRGDQRRMPPAAPPAPPAAVPQSGGAGWANNQSPQQFGVDNPYYGQTGYYGNLEQVQAQVAGHAQSAGKPTGVLDASTYTQNPAGATPWQPAPTAQQTNDKAAQWQQYVDNTGRFLDPAMLDQQFQQWNSTGQLPGGQYPPGTFR